MIEIAIHVVRHIWRKDTQTGLRQQTSEIAFCASQITLDAKTIGNTIRQHWGIEIRHHDVRDITFFEDPSHIRNKPGPLARLRTFALHLIRANRIKNVSRELYFYALSPMNAFSCKVT